MVQQTNYIHPAPTMPSHVEDDTENYPTIWRKSTARIIYPHRVIRELYVLVT